MEVDTLRLIANGVDLLRLTPGVGGIVRLDEEIAVHPPRDTWYVVLAEDGVHTLGPVNPGERIFAITNPIWVDADGNGLFDPLFD